MLFTFNFCHQTLHNMDLMVFLQEIHYIACNKLKLVTCFLLNDQGEISKHLAYDCNFSTTNHFVVIEKIWNHSCINT